MHYQFTFLQTIFWELYKRDLIYWIQLWNHCSCCDAGDFWLWDRTFKLGGTTGRRTLATGGTCCVSVYMHWVALLYLPRGILFHGNQIIVTKLCVVRFLDSEVQSNHHVIYLYISKGPSSHHPCMISILRYHMIPTQLIVTYDVVVVDFRCMKSLNTTCCSVPLLSQLWDWRELSYREKPKPSKKSICDISIMRPYCSI